MAKKAEIIARKLTIEEALVQVVKLFLIHPPYKLTFSKISRVTSIPRSTLYYYFGSRLESLLTEAVRHSLKLFLHLDSVDEELKKFHSWEDFQVHRMTQAMNQVQGSPWAPRVYMLFRDDSGAIGIAAREVEATYLKQMAKAWKYYHPKDAMNEQLEVVANALKMGLLWGISVQLSMAPSQKQKSLQHPESIARKLTDVIKAILKNS